MSGKGESHNGKVKYGARLRSMKEKEPCGDGYFFIPGGDGVVFGLLDGLGHGEGAYEASKKAIESFHANAHLSLDALVMKAHQDIRNTRGCVAFVGKLIYAEKKLQCVSIGNIGSKFQTKTRNLPVQLPGILGANLRKVEITTLKLDSGDSVVLYSDGVSSRFRPEEVLTGEDLGEDAQRIINQHGYSHDDASVLIVKVEFDS